MAANIFIPGLIGVSIKAPGDTVFALLGFCRDGVQIRENVRLRPIHGDEGGGPDGIPVDFSYLGEYHDVRLELYKYDGDVLSKVSNRLSTTADKVRTKVYEPGWLVRSAGDYFLLKLETHFKYLPNPPQPQFSRTYTTAIPTSPIDYPLGPKEMIAVLEFTCLPDASGVVFST